MPVAALVMALGPVLAPDDRAGAALAAQQVSYAASQARMKSIRAETI